MAFFITDPGVGFHLHASAQSLPYFTQFAALIDMPTEFKRRRGPASGDL